MQGTLLILGAGGHGKAIAEAALLSGVWSKVAFVDDRWPSLNTVFGLPVLSNIAGLSEVSSQWDAAIPAVGQNSLRQQWLKAIRTAGLTAATVVHPSACVSPSAVIGEGTAIMALAMIGVDVSIGECSIINAHATVDHDVRLGSFVHLGIGVHLAGGVQIGSNVWLQAGCCAGCGVVVADNEVCMPSTVLS
jgi:sugar O-acyltransferase (sialic acid O-acetyltransferase NeuD family)